MAAKSSREWIKPNETAGEMCGRVMKEHPLLSLPPTLDRFPFRPHNVLEIVGPSPSAKTQILMQAAISCVLPDEYGGHGRLAFFVDLDCRFDISRFSHLLKSKILEVIRKHNSRNERKHIREQVYVMCMRRFIYTRCYDSIEFLSTLKTLHFQLQKETEAQGVSPLFLMIDSIGAFYWVDRALSSALVLSNNRKCLSFQTISETVVQEIKRILSIYPMLVFSTKATILGNRAGINDANWSFKRPSLQDSAETTQYQYREYMPSVWQSFVTHRLLIQETDNSSYKSKHNDQSSYVCQWLLPARFRYKFVVRDDGIICDRG